MKIHYTFIVIIFFLNNSYQSNPKIRNLLDVFFSNLHENKVESLILDLRNNPGGDVSDLNFILGKIVSSPHKFGKIKYKFGNNRQDYSPYLDAFILPINNNTTFNKPIYILTNSKTSSLAELFTIALKSLPNSKVIGNTTSGITGILVTENSLYNGGSFKVGDFMNINISAASVVDLKYTSYEKTGILPDIVINNKDRFTDSQLEYLITIK